MDRLRASIGDMMTDEDLKKIIEKGVDKALFERPLIKDSWRTDYGPSFVEKAVNEFLKDKIAKAVDDWLKTNPEKIEAALRETLKIGVGNLVLQALELRFSNIGMNVASALQSQGINIAIPRT